MTTTPLDRRSPVPLWAQLLGDLRRRVASGEFEDGFPTDEELRHAYGVSRQTVREAARRLQADGVIVRERGRGSALTGSVLEQPLHALYSLATTAGGLGLAERSEVRTLRLERAGAAAGPLELAAGLLGCDLSAGSLYDVLAGTCGVRVTGGWERIRPGVAAPDLCRLLEMADGGAVFEVERLAVAGSVPVEWRQSVVRGDRYSFRADWSAT